MSGKSMFIFSPSLENYGFNNEHPFNPLRMKLTVNLLQEMGLLKPEDFSAPRLASREELLLAHDKLYIDMVEELSNGQKEESEGLIFGLGTEDNPVFSGMHQAASLVVGATLEAAEAVMDGRADHAVNISGGLHHATQSQASGFCIYNDINVAIRHLRKKYSARVVYIDTDAHHGDGVQWEFYEDPHVLTISFHETGRYLFPGTGGVQERGRNQGYGFSVNVPLDAFTEDDSFLECFNEVVPPILHAYQPDIIISQNGCDSHSYDPLTHLSLTMKSFREIPKIVHRLAHSTAGGKWVAVGGGGYDHYRVVARALALLWAEASHKVLDDTIPPSWLERWASTCQVTLPQTISDPEELFKPIPRRAEITEKNRLTAERSVRDTLALLHRLF